MDHGDFDYDEHDKNGFIRKVYGIFTMQLGATTAFIAISMANPQVIVWQVKNMWLFWVLLILGLVCQCTIICNRAIGRTVPINYLLLAFITFSESYLLSMICARYKPQSVFVVALITTAGFVGMTFYAMWTKTDLTVYGSLIAGLSGVMFVMAIVLMFTKIPALLLIYNIIGVVLALLFVAIDTQQITNRKGENALGYDEYVVAALMLYLDFI